LSGSSSLLKALKSERARVAVPGCKVCSWLTSQDPEVGDQVSSWVEDGLQVKALAEVLISNGMPASYTTFRNHVSNCGTPE
jgi:hypothetical protein